MLNKINLKISFCFILIIFFMFFIVGCNNKKIICVTDLNNNIVYCGNYSYYWYGDDYVKIQNNGDIYAFSFVGNGYILSKKCKCGKH